MEDDLNITSHKEVAKKEEVPAEEKRPSKEEKLVSREELLVARGADEKEMVVGLVGVVLRAVNTIRQSNFNGLNLVPMQSNVLSLSLEECKASRYLKYLAFELSLAAYQRLAEVYEPILPLADFDALTADARHLRNEFNKFLLETNFKGKEQLAVALEQLDSPYSLQKELASQLDHTIRNLGIIKENKKGYLLSLLYCLRLPDPFHTFMKVRSLFGEGKGLHEWPREDIVGDVTLEQVRGDLEGMWALEGLTLPEMRLEIEKSLEQVGVMPLYELEEDSDDFEVIEEEDL